MTEIQSIMKYIFIVRNSDKLKNVNKGFRITL